MLRSWGGGGRETGCREIKREEKKEEKARKRESNHPEEAGYRVQTMSPESCLSLDPSV